MNFSDRPPSEQWAALMFRGEQFAEVWFKPDGNPFALTFRIPQSSFQLPGIDQRLTLENLLKAVGIATEEVESCHPEGAAPAELRQPLPPPPPDVPHLILSIRLKPPQIVAPTESAVPAIDDGTWQFLEDRWNTILGLEASVESLRSNMEGLRSEMEAATRKTLPLDIKVNALSIDVVQWNKAKNRIRYAVPKVREFLHRATWATGTPERKKLMELYETYIQPRIPFPQIDEVLGQIEGLLKDRQTLYAQGTAVYQDCKGICAECEGALRTLRANAAAQTSRKSGGLGSRGKGHRS